MAYPEFPKLKGQCFATITPVWNTTVHQSISALETRISNQSRGQMKIKFKFSHVTETDKRKDLQTLINFFGQAKGKLYPFAFTDPYNNFVKRSIITTGTTNKTMQLGISSPCFYDSNTYNLSFTHYLLDEKYKNKFKCWANNILVDAVWDCSKGTVTVKEEQVTIEVEYYYKYLCRFNIDEMDLQMIASGLYTMDEIELITVYDVEKGVIL